MPPVRRMRDELPLMTRINELKDSKRKRVLLQMDPKELEEMHEGVLFFRDELLQLIHENETVIEKEEAERRAMHVEYVAVCKELDSYSTFNPKHKKWTFKKEELKLVQQDPELTKLVFDVVEKARAEFHKNPRDFRLDKKIRAVRKQFEGNEDLVNIAFDTFCDYVDGVDWSHRMRHFSLVFCKQIKNHWYNTIYKKAYSIDYLLRKNFSDDKFLDMYKRKAELTKKKRAAVEAKKYREIKKLKKLYRRVRVLRAASHEELEDSSCLICLEEMEKNEAFYKLPNCTACRRRFHKQCIEPWLKKTSQCPLCKMSLFGFDHINQKKFRVPYDQFSTMVEYWWTNMRDAYDPEPGDLIHGPEY